MIQRATLENPEGNAQSPERAALGAAVDAENSPADPDLQLLINQWPSLRPSVRSAILKLLATEGDLQQGE